MRDSCPPTPGPRVYATLPLSGALYVNGLSEIQPPPELSGDKESNASLKSNDNDALVFRCWQCRADGAYLDKFQVTREGEPKDGERMRLARVASIHRRGARSSHFGLHLCPVDIETVISMLNLAYVSRASVHHCSATT